MQTNVLFEERGSECGTKRRKSSKLRLRWGCGGDDEGGGNGGGDGDGGGDGGDEGGDGVIMIVTVMALVIASLTAST